MSVFPEVTDELVRRYDVPAPRYTSYPTHPLWTTGFAPADLEEKLREASRLAEPLSLYVHLPFCRSLCTFCGCNVVVAKDAARADAYLDRVARELDIIASRLGDRRTLSSLHWGGGTPTFLEERQIERLFSEITSRFTIAPSAEVAIEMNPTVTEAAKVALLRRLGFNRLSLGVQDFDPRVQEAIGRIQTIEETAALVADARRLGFTSVNVDLVYGLPRQTPATWEKTLDAVFALRPDRAAVYSFAYVPDVRPHQRAIAASDVSSGRAKLELFGIAYEAFCARGYRPIGMDHFALPTDELSRAQERRTLWRNFQGYTAQPATDVVAAGATGISDVQGAYAQSVRPLGRYYAAIDKGELATERGMLLSEDDRRRRAIITSLMCNFWVDLGSHEGFEAELDVLRAKENEGLVRVRGTEVELTPLGRIFVRNVATVFDAHLAKSERRFSRAV